MKGYIIVNFHPFDLYQTISVYQNGEEIANYTTPIEELNSLIPALCKQYEIKNVDLCGNVHYLSKFKAEMKLKFADESDINIGIINK